MKAEIALALDERGLVRPDLMRRALEANERAKYHLSLLQMARMHADAPYATAPTLSSDRVHAGIEDERLDRVIESAVALGDAYRIAGARGIVDAAFRETREMIDPLRASGDPSASSFEGRLDAIVGEIVTRPDSLSSEGLALLTSAERDVHDSLHLLVMDVHKALDKEAARYATETIDGASAFGIEPADRPLVAAFAEGVQRTSHLKFGHVGLATTATRYGGRLVLENDIGATDAHVIVVHVEETRITITASDVHVARLQFLRRLVEPFQVRWDDLSARTQATLNEGDAFYVAAGSYEVEGPAARAAFLGHLGERLVFLIDWNRARKQLQRFVSKGDALALLVWAADEHIGHRAFLEAGGERFVFDAMAGVMRAPLRFGERLDDVLGPERAAAFLRIVLRETTEGRLAGRSRALVAERVRTELARELAEAGERLLEPVMRHATLIRDLAGLVRAAVQGERPTTLVEEAKQREHEADDVVVETRRIVERLQGMGAFLQILEAADDAADALDEAAFGLTLLPGRVAELERLADLALASATAYGEAAARARPASATWERTPMESFLEAAERVVQLERQADTAERAVMADVMRQTAPDPRRLVLVTRVAHHLEEATDALALAVLRLRDRTTGASGP